MRRSSLSRWGRFCMRLAALGQPPYKARRPLARLGSFGYVAPSAIVYGDGIALAVGCFVDERVTIFQHPGGGPVTLAERVHLYRDCIVETGPGGSLSIGEDTHVQPRCQFTAFAGPIRIGARVQIAPNCSFYPYDHSFAAGRRDRGSTAAQQGRHRHRRRRVAGRRRHSAGRRDHRRRCSDRRGRGGDRERAGQRDCGRCTGAGSGCAAVIYPRRQI